MGQPPHGLPNPSEFDTQIHLLLHRYAFSRVLFSSALGACRGRVTLAALGVRLACKTPNPAPRPLHLISLVTDTYWQEGNILLIQSLNYSTFILLRGVVITACSHLLSSDRERHLWSPKYIKFLFVCRVSFTRRSLHFSLWVSPSFYLLSITNFMAYETQRLNNAFTRAHQ